MHLIAARRSALAMCFGTLSVCHLASHAAAAQDQPAPPAPKPRPQSQWSPEEKAVRACLDYYTALAKVQWYAECGWARGWAKRCTPDHRLRHGHAGQPVPQDVVCLQHPGTVMMARTYLLAYSVLAEPEYLERAKEVGHLLLAAQTQAGGWGKDVWMGRTQANTVRTGSGLRHWPGSDPPNKIRGQDLADLDEGNTRDAMDFLYQLWWLSRDDRFLQAYHKALDFHLLAQEAAGGGFPETYPATGYQAHASFFGETILAAVHSLRLGYERTGRQKYLDAIIRCADWLLTVRKPAQGWGMRYDRQGHLAPGRLFEPPALSSESTLFAIMTLGIAHEYTADPRYLTAIQDAAAWLRRLPAPKGISPRFIHPDSNKPWFVDGAGNEVRDPQRARKGYLWYGYWAKTGFALAERLAKTELQTPRRPPQGGDPSAQAHIPLRAEIPALAKRGVTVEKLLASQTSEGYWSTDVDGLDMLTIGATCNRLQLLLAELHKRQSAEAGPDPTE